MGFGFNLFFAFILLPLTAILAVIWLLVRKEIVGRLIGFTWLGVLGIVLLSLSIQWLTAKTQLEKEDYYGEYIIDREYFPGQQADWQYNHFRFEIRENDSIYLYVTEEEKISKIFQGTITTAKPYDSERLIVQMDQPTSHIMAGNPTTYRSAWGYYLVFYSTKFNNMYFKKGKWKPISR